MVYRAELDGLRGLAIALVLAYHFRLGLSGGFVGVDVFFVLSGYLISGYLVAQLQAGSLSLRNFWERRCRRLLPALLPVVFGSLVAGWVCLLPDELLKLGQVLVGQSVLATHVAIWKTAKFGYFADPVDSRPLLHLWSLGLEEQFYLFLPLLLMALRPARARAGLALLVVGSLAVSVWQTAHQPLAAFYLPFSRAWELALGGWLATVRQPGGLRRREILGWSGLVMIGASACQFDYKTPFPGLAALLPCLGAAALLASGGQPTRTLWERLLAFPPIVWLGLISYPLYLFHWPLLAFASYLRCRPLDLSTRVYLLLLSLALAAVFTLLVERPIRRSGYRLGRASLVFLLACAIVGVALVRGQGYPSRFSARALSLAADDPYAMSAVVTVPQIRGDQAKKLGEEGGSGPPFLVWGDSNGMVVCSMLDSLGRQYHCPGYAITHGNTPALVRFKPLPGEFALPGDQESQWGPATLEFVRRHKIKKVFLVCLWTSYPIDGEEIPETLKALQQAGADCWIMAPIPQPPLDIRRAALLADRGVIASPSPLPPEAVAYNQTLFQKRISKCRPGSYHLIDPLTILRDPGSGAFPYFYRGKLLYHDTCHLSVEGNLRLRSLFEEAFRN